MVVQKAFEEAISSAFGAYQAKRSAVAREVLLSRMARGRPWLAIDDKEAFMVMRFARAAVEGAAVRNLELLADAVVTGEEDAALTIDEFKRQADNVADLTWEEIVILAAVIRQMRASPCDLHDFKWQVLRAELSGAGRRFRSARDLDDQAGALTRTGYLWATSAYGALSFRPTARLIALARLADLEAAVKRHEPDAGHI